MSRADKYLWSVRIYKTRSDASDACRGGKVKINDSDCKPSKEIKAGDIIEVRKKNIYFKYKVKEIIDRRQPASNVPVYAEDITPQSELDKLNQPKETISIFREKGTGRPTKKERRQIDDLLGI